MKDVKVQLLCHLKDDIDEKEFNAKLDNLCKQFSIVVVSSDLATDDEDRGDVDNFIKTMTKSVAETNNINIQHMFSEQVKAVLNVILTAGVGEQITLADMDRTKDIVWERIR